jgi:hypothetical protein
MTSALDLLVLSTLRILLKPFYGSRSAWIAETGTFLSVFSHIRIRSISLKSQEIARCEDTPREFQVFVGIRIFKL